MGRRSYMHSSNLADMMAVTFNMIGLLFAIVGFGTPYWLKFETGSGDDFRGTNLGLWQICVSVGSDNKTCEPILDASELKEWYTVSIATGTITMVTLLISTCLLVYWMCSHSRYMFNKIVTMVILIIAFLCMLATVIIYRVKYEDEYEDFDLDWSYYVFVAGIPQFGVVVGLLSCIPSYEQLPGLPTLQPPRPLPLPPPAVRINAPPLIPGAINSAPLVLPAHATVLPPHLVPPQASPQHPRATPVRRNRPAAAAAPKKPADWSWRSQY